MESINKKEYSIFYKNSSESIDDKKTVEYINQLICCICELYDIQVNEDNLNSEIDFETITYLIRLGVIKNIAEIERLEKLLGSTYSKTINIIQQYTKLNIKEEMLINRFMDEYRREKLEEYLKDKSSPTLVDFFCGAGGMSLGFSQNGFKVLLANDIEEVCTETYAFNHPEIPRSKVIHGDIKNIVDDIQKHIEDEVDVVIGGPPCQGFSMANRQRIIDDPRNILYKYYVKGIQKLKPKFFVMENVKGMLSVAEQVKEDFHSLNCVDYDVEYHMFNAKEFGVPQNRERLIYIGVRSDIKEKIGKSAYNIIEEIEMTTKDSKRTVLEDAIDDLRPLQASKVKNSTEVDSVESGKRIDKRVNSEVNDFVKLINMEYISPIIFNHKARYNNDRDIEIFGRMLPGDKSDSERIADIMPYHNRNDIFKDKYYKLKPNEVCKTITAHMKFDCNMYIHPYQSRGLTPREAARVQTYPDHYMFCGAYTKTYMQVGNSVPPLMSKRIASVIKKYIR